MTLSALICPRPEPDAKFDLDLDLNLTGAGGRSERTHTQPLEGALNTDRKSVV